MAPRRARVSAKVGTHHMAPAVVASSISRPGKPWLSSPRPSRSLCRGGRIRPSRPSVRLGAVNCLRLHPEGRGRCCLVHLEARVEEGGYGPTEREGVGGGRDASHGAGCRCLVHLEARKAAAVVASYSSRPASRRADAAPRRERAYAGVGTRPMAPAVVASSISRPRRPRPRRTPRDNLILQDNL